jgi:hypothetical protein
MRRGTRRFTAAAWLALSLLARAPSPAAAQTKAAEPSDVRALLLEVARNERALLARRLEYTWTALVIDRELGRRGEVTSESSSLYEVYPVRGEFARKLLERDGAPLPREQAERELKRAAERLEKAAREEQKRAESKQQPPPDAASDAQAQNPLGIPSFGFSTGHRESRGLGSTEISMSVWRFFRYCEFTRPRAVSLKGREAFALDFRPRADFRPADELQKPYARLRGRVWIDAADLTVARLEAWPDGARAEAAEPAVVFEHERLGEGVWIERFVRIKTYGHREIFNGIELDFTKQVTNFKRFSSVAGDDKLDAPPDQDPSKP